MVSACVHAQSAGASEETHQRPRTTSLLVRTHNRLPDPMSSQPELQPIGLALKTTSSRIMALLVLCQWCPDDAAAQGDSSIGKSIGKGMTRQKKLLSRLFTVPLISWNCRESLHWPLGTVPGLDFAVACSSVSLRSLDSPASGVSTALVSSISTSTPNLNLRRHSLNGVSRACNRPPQDAIPTPSA